MLQTLLTLMLLSNQSLLDATVEEVAAFLDAW
jgi:hypothetical protein